MQKIYEHLVVSPIVKREIERGKKIMSGKMGKKISTDLYLRRILGV